MGGATRFAGSELDRIGATLGSFPVVPGLLVRCVLERLFCKLIEASS